MGRRFLIINPFGIGDVLFSTPLVSAVKKNNPGCHIGYLCNRRTKDILETNPEIDEVFVFERDEYRLLWKKRKGEFFKKILRFWRTISDRQFDIMIDLSLGKEYAFFCWLVGIKKRIGFNYNGRGIFLTRKLRFNGFNDKPVSEYYLDLLPSPYRREAKDEGMKIVLFPSSNDKVYIDNFLKESGIKEEETLIGIAPGGGVSFGRDNQDKRRWGKERFSELADRIIERFNVRVILIWGPGEEGLVNRIAGFMKEDVLLAPKTSIREMAALCKRCKMVICSEGGPLHIACSQGVKTLSIFGPVDEKVYGPYPRAENNIVITANVECRPCYSRFRLPECHTKKCLEEVSVGMVFRALSRRDDELKFLRGRD